MPPTLVLPERRGAAATGAERTLRQPRAPTASRRHHGRELAPTELTAHPPRQDGRETASRTWGGGCFPLGEQAPDGGGALGVVRVEEAGDAARPGDRADIPIHREGRRLVRLLWPRLLFSVLHAPPPPACPPPVSVAAPLGGSLSHQRPAQVEERSSAYWQLWVTVGLSPHACRTPAHPSVNQPQTGAHRAVGVSSCANKFYNKVRECSLQRHLPRWCPMVNPRRVAFRPFVRTAQIQPGAACPEVSL